MVGVPTDLKCFSMEGPIPSVHIQAKSWTDSASPSIIFRRWHGFCSENHMFSQCIRFLERCLPPWRWGLEPPDPEPILVRVQAIRRSDSVR